MIGADRASWRTCRHWGDFRLLAPQERYDRPDEPAFARSAGVHPLYFPKVRGEFVFMPLYYHTIDAMPIDFGTNLGRISDEF